MAMCSTNVSIKVVEAPGYATEKVEGCCVFLIPAWGGFVSVELCCKFDAMFKRLKRYGYITDYLTYYY